MDNEPNPASALSTLGSRAGDAPASHAFGAGRSRAPAAPAKDLTPALMESYSWDAASAESSLNALFDHAREDARQAILWYLRKKARKKTLATLCRVVALAMAGFGALLPLMAQIGQASSPPAPIEWLRSIGFLEPVAVTIVLALAAGALIVDRAWGASSGWLRFITTELKLRDHLEAFELDWQRERARWWGQPPTPVQVDAMVEKVAVFTAHVNAIVQEETRMWMEDFRSSLRELEEALKARREAAQIQAAQASEAGRAREETAALASQPAAANVAVTNVAELDDASWTLSIDNGDPRRVRGVNAAVPRLSPGVRTFAATGQIDGRVVSSERAVDVRAGAIAVIELTLS